MLETQNIPELQGQVIALLKQGEIKKAEERVCHGTVRSRLLRIDEQRSSVRESCQRSENDH